MTFVFALAFSFLHTLPATAYQEIRSELHSLHWQQSTLLAGFVSPVNQASQNFQLRAPRGGSIEARMWKTRGGSRGLYFVIPGTGSPAKSPLANRLAEILNGWGYDAIVVANSFSPEFQTSFSSDGLVGFAEKDSADTIQMLRAARAAYVGSYGQPREVNILGFSLGALLAELAARDAPDLRINKVVALDPPVDFNFAVRKLDAMVRRHLAKDYSLPALAGDLLHLFSAANGGVSASNAPSVLDALPRNDVENEQIIGMSFFSSLQKVEQNLAQTFAFQTQDAQFRVQQLNNSITFTGYTNLIAGAVLRRRPFSGISVDQAFQRLDLRSILRAAPDLADRSYVITNRDDMIVTTAMLTELDTILPNQLFVFDAGGHCGNYWTASFARQLRAIVLGH